MSKGQPGVRQIFKTRAILGKHLSHCDIEIHAMDFKLDKDVATSFLLRFTLKKLLNLQGMSLYMPIK